MKKLALLIFLSIILQQTAISSIEVFSNNDKFGLKNNSEILVEAKYKKLIKLGESAWIMQYGNKFGVIRNDGNVVVEPKYQLAERVLGKYVKLKKGQNYGIFDENGFAILPVEYLSIDLLYGGMFVTSKDYKYGIADLNGQILLDNIFDDIYMPDLNTLVIVYNNKKIKIKKESGQQINIPVDIVFGCVDNDINFSDITASPIASTGYYGITLTDYILKLFSSISPAYEQTIDELMYSKGADSVSVIMQCSWIPKFPFAYLKNYYHNIKAPNNGPLYSIKKNIKQNIKN